MTRPTRKVRLGPRDIVVERRADGCTLLRSPHALGPYPRKLTERLEFWAAEAPGRLFLAERQMRKLQFRLELPLHRLSSKEG